MTTDTAKKYELIHNWLFLLEIILTLTGIIVLIVGGIGGMSGKLSCLLNIHIPNIWLKNGAYVGILSISYTLLFLPLSFYKGYVLEHKFKLSNQSVWNWTKDNLKAFCISLILSIIIIEITYLLIRKTGSLWWIYLGFFWLFFTVILNHLAPIILIPLFFKLTPLANTELAEKLKELAKKAGTHILGVFEIDFSKKTKKANAAFTGIGRTKRILLADNLVREYKSEEIEVIFSHELGHYYYKHLWKLLSIGVMSTFIGLGIGHKFFTSSVYKLGFSGISDIGALPVLLLILFGFMLLALPFNNAFSRRFEKQADIFSILLTKNPRAFIDSMNKLANQNLTNISPNPVIHFLLHNHPSIKSRIEMAERYL